MSRTVIFSALIALGFAATAQASDAKVFNNASFGSAKSLFAAGGFEKAAGSTFAAITDGSSNTKKIFSAETSGTDLFSTSIKNTGTLTDASTSFSAIGKTSLLSNSSKLNATFGVHTK